MCGIAGIIFGQGKEAHNGNIKRMIDVIEHRGPDGDGIAHFDKVILGHRRLSIIDLSSKGAQPFQYKDLTISYNGEIYNYIELREVLMGFGYTFRSDTDTEVLIAAYDYWGENCVDHLNGMWAFAIYDPNKNIVFCSRDRFGIKPFYYTEIDGDFYFASEIKQFTVIEGWRAVLNKQVAASYFGDGLQEYENVTFFEGVYRLKGGNNLIYNLSNQSFSIQRYYSLKEQVNTLSLIDERENYRSLLSDAVRLRLRADVAIGTALSGGIDSSVVTGIINKLLEGGAGSRGIQKTISACFKGFKLNEEPFIDAVCSKHKVESLKTFVDFDDFKEHLSHFFWTQDEPISTSSVFAQYMVYKTASENDIKVMLDGQGADESLGGYFASIPPFLLQMKTQFGPLQMIDQAVQIARKQPREFFRYVTRKLTLKFKRTTYSVPSIMRENPIKWSPTFRSNNRFTQVCYNMLFDITLPALLRYQDRNSMAFSVESRVPFLDYRLVEQSLNMNMRYKIKHGVRKFILRESFKDVLPAKIYKRYDKIGFVTPQDKWFREHSDFIHLLLSEAPIKTKGMISKSFIEKLNVSKHSTIMWKIISFSEWMHMYEVSI